MKTVILFASLLALSGCIGATVSNTDKPKGLYSGLAGAPKLEVADVQLVQTNPDNTGLEVEGVACKNKIWEPAPTTESAIQVAKIEAAKFGFSKLRLTSVVEGGNFVDLRRNCWSVVVAKGIAFN